MAVPVTFSPPGTAYEPSIEDALRDGVLLMLRADDITRKAYSYDDDDPAKGVRIFAGLAHTNRNDGRIVVEQLVVTIAIASNRFTYTTSKAGEKTITVALTHFEGPESDYIAVDVETPQVTPETKLARLEEVLMRGTLFIAGQESNSGKVVDPYRSPLLVGGTYDPDAIVYLNELSPGITRATPQPIVRKTRDDGQKVDPMRDIAVAYSLIATYTVQIPSRENMRRGGFNG